MCVCALGVRALLISVFCCFGPFCGRGRPQDLVERVGFEISCRNQGSLPSGIGSKAIFGVGDRPGGPSCVIRKKRSLCSPAVLEINVLDVSTHFLFLFVRGPRFWALGVDSGPRGGAFEGVLDPRKNKIYIFLLGPKRP